MSDGDVIFSILFWGVILFIIYLYYQNSKWNAEREIIDKREKVRAELANVQFYIEKYKLALSSAKETLAMGIHFAEREQIDDTNDSSGMTLIANRGFGSDNIYTLLVSSQTIIAKARDDLFGVIERSNAKLERYNTYIQFPVLPRIVAGEIGADIIPFEGNRLTQIENLVNIHLVEINRLENNIAEMMGVPVNAAIKGIGPTHQETQMDVEGELTFYDK